MRFDLKKTLFILPNLFTLSSVFCGFYAILICGGEPSGEDLHKAALLIVFAAFFDAIDGRVARMTKTQSAFGVQMDSLADVMSFGLAPALLIYKWSLHRLGWLGLIVSFGFLACGAIRLARFNVLASTPSSGGDGEKKASKYFVGLPIPGAAAVLICLVIANHEMAGHLPSIPYAVLGIMASLAFFMVSTIRFRTFKDLKLSKRSFILIVLVIGASVVVALQLDAPVVALVVLLSTYLLIAMVEMVISLSRRGLRLVRGGEEEEEPEPTTPGSP